MKKRVIVCLLLVLLVLTSCDLFKQPEEPKEPKITSIGILTYPTKQTYYMGDSVDTTGLVLICVNDDGSLQGVTSGYSVTPQVINQKGSQEITIKYKGFETSYMVNVKELIYRVSSFTQEDSSHTFTYSNFETSLMGDSISYRQVSNQNTITSEETYSSKVDSQISESNSLCIVSSISEYQYEYGGQTYKGGSWKNETYEMSPTYGNICFEKETEPYYYSKHYISSSGETDSFGNKGPVTGIREDFYNFTDLGLSDGLHKVKWEIVKHLIDGIEVPITESKYTILFLNDNNEIVKEESYRYDSYEKVTYKEIEEENLLKTTHTTLHLPSSLKTYKNDVLSEEQTYKWSIVKDTLEKITLSLEMTIKTYGDTTETETSSMVVEYTCISL